MADWLLTRRDHSWTTRIYVSRDNPQNETDELGEAYRFPTREAAIHAKKGLGHDRRFAARKMPEWLT